MLQLAAAGEGKERTQQNGRANKIIEANLGRKEAMKWKVGVKNIFKRKRKRGGSSIRMAI